MEDRFIGLRMQHFSHEEYLALKQNCACDKNGAPYTQRCVKCGTPNHKVLYLPWTGEYCEVPFMCACRLEREGKFIEAREAREFDKRQNALRQTIPAKYRLCTISEMYPSKGKEIAIDFVDKWDEFYLGNLGLYIYGRMGVGKSYMAAAIANGLIAKGVSVLFTDFTDLVGRMEEGYGNRNRVLGELKRYDLVIIDDYGAERGSEYMLEQIFSVVKRRLESGQPLIFTSNMPWAWVEDGTNDWSRVNGRIMEMCVPVLLEGDDKRKIAQSQKRQMVLDLRGGAK